MKDFDFHLFGDCKKHISNDKRHPEGKPDFKYSTTQEMSSKKAKHIYKKYIEMSVVRALFQFLCSGWTGSGANGEACSIRFPNRPRNF